MLPTPENPGASDSPEQPENWHVPDHLAERLRLAMRNVIGETPDAVRLHRLRERVESGEIREVFDGGWVAQCYLEQEEMGIDQPCITSADTRGGAILLTLEDMQMLGAFEYMNPSGKTIVIDDTSMEAGHCSTLIVFPEEIGGATGA